MTLAVPKKKWAALKKLLDRHDVEATRIGTFTDSGSCVVRYKGKTIMDIDMGFLHDGRPIKAQKSAPVSRKHTEPTAKIRRVDIKLAFEEIISRANVGSIAPISQQYDHEVQGTSVTKPLQGRGRVNADSAVLKPIPDSSRGIVLSQGYCPWYSDIDTYAMAATAIDTAVRNAICAGASRDHLAILDNFCWSSSDTPERLYELKRAARACFDIATAYGTPFISGKDSMYNDFEGFSADGKPTHIAVPPTLLISAIGVIPSVERSVTLDLKCSGDAIYLLGETDDELGASEYFAWLGDKEGKKLVGNTVPKVSAHKNAAAYDLLSESIARGLAASAIGVGRGGLAVALAKTTIAGQLGADVDIENIPGAARRADSILFSESQGRILVSIRPDAEKEFVGIIRHIPHVRIGEVSNKPALSIKLPGPSIDMPLSKLTDAYRRKFKDL